MKRFVVICLIALVSVSWLFAMDAYFSGETTFEAIVSVPPVEEPWTITSADINQSFEIDAYSDNSSLYVNAGFSVDALAGKLDWFLSEAYMDLFIDRFSFRFGRQKASWGTAEIQSAVDVLTPTDMSDPISMDKMGIDSLKFSIDAFPLALDVYWIPIFTPSPLPASVAAMLAFYGIELKKPELKFKNSEVGVKASAYTSAGDFALYGYYGWEDTPSMTGEYERLAMAGGSFAIPIGEVTFKGEAAWYPKRDEEYAATFGLEWMHGDFTFIAEAYGACDTQNVSLNSQVGAVFSYDLLDGDLQLSLSGIVEMKKYDGAVLFGASYAVSDEMKITAQVIYVFEGPDEAGTYGAYKDLDCVKLGATYSF